MLWIVYKEASNILLKLLVVCAVNGKTLVEIPDSEGNEPFIGVLQCRFSNISPNSKENTCDTSLLFNKKRYFLFNNAKL